jgi:hypothetical protein
MGKHEIRDQSVDGPALGDAELHKAVVPIDLHVQPAIVIAKSKMPEENRRINRGDYE